MRLALLALAVAAAFPGTAPAQSAATPEMLAQRYRPEPYRLTGRERFFALSNGLAGSTAGDAVKRKAVGIDWGQFMTGAAYAMAFDPDRGADCNKDGKPDGRQEFWTLDADPAQSRLVVNPRDQQGAVLVVGKTTHYLPASDFCETRAFTAREARAAGFIYLPISARGGSPRNFTAGAVLGRTDQRYQSEQVRRAVFAAGTTRLTLGPYLSPQVLGQSQALAEGPGGACAAQALAQNMGSGAQAEALRKLPGLVPGPTSQGWMELQLSDKPVSEITGRRPVPFVFLQLRVVHALPEARPGPGIEGLPELLGDFADDPRQSMGR